MSPEHLAAVQDRKVELDERADVYSLGIVLFEMLFHRAGYPDRARDFKSTLQQMIVDRQQLPSMTVDWQRGSTPAIIQILSLALARDPANRYQTAAQFRDDLRLQMENKPLRHARDYSFLERVGKWNARHPRVSAMMFVSIAAGSVLLRTISWFVFRQARIDTLEAENWMTKVVQSQSVVRNLMVSEVHAATVSS